MSEMVRYREHLRQFMLSQMAKPESTGKRETYTDGFIQGLAYAIGEIDKVIKNYRKEDGQ